MQRPPKKRETKSEEGLDPLTGHDHAFHEEALTPEFADALKDKAMKGNPALARYLGQAKKKR